MTGDYKPVPDDLLTVLERLVDAGEVVIAWYEVTDGLMDLDDCGDAMDSLHDAVTKATAYLVEIR